MAIELHTVDDRGVFRDRRNTHTTEINGKKYYYPSNKDRSKSFEKAFGLTWKEWKESEGEERVAKKAAIERRIEIACKRMAPDMINHLELMFYNEDIDAAVRLKIAQEVLNRGFGKPSQRIQAEVSHTVQGYAESLEKAKLRALGHKPPALSITEDIIEGVYDELTEEKDIDEI